jgi:hypothetical protein
LTAAGIDAMPVKGEKSQFDVVRDGEVVWSKQREHRWPDDGEVLGLLA